MIFKKIKLLFLLTLSNTFISAGLESYCLVKAVNKEDIKEVENLIKQGKDVNFNYANFGSPLTNAAGKGNWEIVKLLLKNGADVDELRCNRASAWNLTKNPGILKLLLKYGATISNYAKPDTKEKIYWEKLLKSIEEENNYSNFTDLNEEDKILLIKRWINQGHINLIFKFIDTIDKEKLSFFYNFLVAIYMSLKANSNFLVNKKSMDKVFTYYLKNINREGALKILRRDLGIIVTLEKKYKLPNVVIAKVLEYLPYDYESRYEKSKHRWLSFFHRHCTTSEPNSLEEIDNNYW